MDTAIETRELSKRESSKQAVTRTIEYRRVRPVVDVFESDAEYRIHVEVPGVESGDVQLTLEHDALRLEATRRQHTHEPLVYDRTFALPDVVDSANVGAQLSAGVLTVTLPKRAAAQPRQIEVKGA